jgi:hypothetical protein
MKNRDEELSKVESVTTIIVNIGTILSWIITLITAVTLIAQPQPVVIPGAFELGKPYTLTFLVSILFGYLQMLRHFWHRSRFTKSESESSFISYLFASIVRFKRPFVLIGFVLILIPLFQVEPFGLLFITILVVAFGGGSLLHTGLEAPEILKWKLDDEHAKRWLKRVRNRLHEYGYVLSTDFNNLHVDRDAVNYAIENYFDRYEFEQRLVLTKLDISKPLETEPVYFLEVRYSHLPTKMPKK